MPPKTKEAKGTQMQAGCHDCPGCAGPKRTQVKSPGIKASGTPGARANGTPEARASGTPGTRASGTPEARASGTLGARASGTPQARASGTPWARARRTPLTVARGTAGQPGAKGSANTPGKTEGKGPCPWLCNLVPNNVPPPGAAQTILHPRKDVFLLKIAKVGAAGDRRCKMELELVTPKYPEKKPLCRIDTRETQCDPDEPPSVCWSRSKSRKSKKMR